MPERISSRDLSFTICMSVLAICYFGSLAMIGREPERKPTQQPCTVPKAIGFEKDGWRFAYQCAEGQVILTDEPLGEGRN